MNQRMILGVLFLFFGAAAFAQTYPVSDITVNGTDESRIIFVYMSDGYQEAELGQFIQDAEVVTNDLFTNTPFLEYRDFFNVYAIEVPSEESGADHPATASDVSEPVFPEQDIDNRFGSTFDYFDIHRLLVPTNNFELGLTLAQNTPDYDQALILVNSPHYGGSGGVYATSSTHPSASEIAIHELGHSFAQLADEYYAGDSYAGERANMTKETDPGLVKWNAWMDEQGIGIYQHCCSGNSAEWYRPHQSCKMRSLGNPFCAVCTETLIDKIYTKVTPISATSPATQDVTFTGTALNFSADLIYPDPNTLEVEWLLDGDVIADGATLVTVDPDQLEGKSSATLQLRVEDVTELSRSYQFPNGYVFTASWTINNDLVDAPHPVVTETFTYKIFPNPTQDQIQVRYFTTNDQEELLLRLMDASGKEVFQGTRPTTIGWQTWQVALPSLAAGTYTGELLFDGYRKGFQIVIQ
jgi:hypothetical protein